MYVDVCGGVGVCVLMAIALYGIIRLEWSISIAILLKFGRFSILRILKYMFLDIYIYISHYQLVITILVYIG